jgi:hypothetical protein
VKAPFSLEPYLTDLRDRTAWAPDCAIEQFEGECVSRPALHRIAHLWALGLLDDRFDTLLLPVLVSGLPLLDCLGAESRDRRWRLSRDFFSERLESGACLLLVDGPSAEAVGWAKNRRFVTAHAATGQGSQAGIMKKRCDWRSLS